MTQCLSIYDHAADEYHPYCEPDEELTEVLRFLADAAGEEVTEGQQDSTDCTGTEPRSNFWKSSAACTRIMMVKPLRSRTGMMMQPPARTPTPTIPQGSVRRPEPSPPVTRLTVMPNVQRHGLVDDHHRQRSPAGATGGVSNSGYDSG